MAVESFLSQDLMSRKRQGSEPTNKKKLKKTRSIKLSKVASLKLLSSSRRSKSRFTWLSIHDFSTDASSTAPPLHLSDSLPNYMKSTTSSDAKKDFSQGGNEIDDAASVGSSSYGSSINGLPVLNKATRIQKIPKTYGSSRSFRRRVKSRIVEQHPSVVSPNVSDGSPKYFKLTSSSGGRKVNSHQASPQHSESSFDESDQNSSYDSRFKSGSSSQRSLQTLARTPSVKFIMNKTSFKPKRSSLKRSQVSEDLNVHRATCSSTLKGKRFSENVELHSKPMEGERIETMKVCPYHHCSLHGHRHGNDPPPKRSLYKKGGPLKSQKNTKPESESTSSVKSSGSKKKDSPISKTSSKVEGSSQEVGVSGAVLVPLKDDKEMSFSIEIYANIRAHVSTKSDAKSVDIPLGESSYHGESTQGSLNQMMSLIKSLSDLKENSAGCSCKTKVHTEVDPEVHEVIGSPIGNEDRESTIDDEKADHSLAHLPDSHINPDNPLVQNDANVKDESWKNERLTLAQDSDDSNEPPEDKSMINPLDDVKSSPGEENSNASPDDIFVAGTNRVGDSEPDAASLEGNRAVVNKNKHISMWHMIHRQMASSLALNADTKADKGKEVDDINTLPAPTISETTQNSDLNIDTENQDLELRKVFAIKLVREAIEKILLPEIPDQSSDDQSVTSDAVSEQDLSEKNHGEECSEDSERKGHDDASADLQEAGHNADHTVGTEKEKTEKKQEKKSDKKAPKHWSNLKKWIILQRFVKALEKVRKFNPSKPQLLDLEPDPEAEKVSLRRQTVEDRKRTEEWMLDYALRQAVSQLAPTQKKKVALLVKAFETVVPPQEDSGIRFSFSKLKENSDESPRSPKDINEYISQKSNTTQEARKFPRGTPFCTTEGSSLAVGGESLVISDIMSSSPENISLKNSITSPKETSEESKLAHVNLETHEDTTSSHDFECPNVGSVGVKSIETNVAGGEAGELSSESKLVTQDGKEKTTTTFSDDCSFSYSGEKSNRESRPEPTVLQGFFRTDSDVNGSEEVKKDQIKMWHMVYQHVVSSIAEKVGSKLLDGTDDEAEDANELSESSMTNQEAGSDKNATYGFSRIEALKLVQEAVDEILLPETQDDSSETQSVTSDVGPDQELSENNHIEGGQQNTLNSLDPTKDILRKMGSSEGVNLSVQEEKGRELITSSKSEPPKPKNWRKLKKLLLLKRSINALQKSRNLKSQPSKILPLTANPEPEKVDLRNQMTNERKKAEQWMLDYAVQHIVHKLTPARKKRVAMLVEAFEAVVPLPEI